VSSGIRCSRSACMPTSHQNFGISAGLFESGNGEAELLLPVELAQEWEDRHQVRVASGPCVRHHWPGSICTSATSVRPYWHPPWIPRASHFSWHGARNEGLEADFRGEIFPGLTATGQLRLYRFPDHWRRRISVSV